MGTTINVSKTNKYIEINNNYKSKTYNNLEKLTTLVFKLL
ncbi:MAG: hypothetical protein BWX96_00670 [Bacteroidetes bacterium ADurb.Bin145]|jgi:hypothetical protein|nr:MAG: hypothetical protein BWX96_00670 [Bacteroidetes bacterium ADurb.Bin145]